MPYQRVRGYRKQQEQQEELKYRKQCYRTMSWGRTPNAGRGRDVSCLTPPARIRTGAFTHTALTGDVWRRSADWDRDEGWQVGEASGPQERRGEAK